MCTFGVWYILTRIIYGIGYILEAIYKIKLLRTPGYIMGTVSILILVVENFQIF